MEQQLTGTLPDSGLSIGQEGVHGLVTELRKLLFFLVARLPLVILSLVLVFSART